MTAMLISQWMLECAGVIALAFVGVIGLVRGLIWANEVEARGTLLRSDYEIRDRPTFRPGLLDDE